MCINTATTYFCAHLGFKERFLVYSSASVQYIYFPNALKNSYLHHDMQEVAVARIFACGWSDLSSSPLLSFPFPPSSPPTPAGGQESAVSSPSWFRAEPRPKTYFDAFTALKTRVVATSFTRLYATYKNRPNISGGSISNPLKYGMPLAVRGGEQLLRFL